MSWLHGVAFRIASLSEVATARRRRHERRPLRWRPPASAERREIRTSSPWFFTKSSIGSRTEYRRAHRTLLLRWTCPTSKPPGSSAGRSGRSEAACARSRSAPQPDSCAGGWLRRSSSLERALAPGMGVAAAVTPALAGATAACGAATTARADLAATAVTSTSVASLVQGAMNSHVTGQ